MMLLGPALLGGQRRQLQHGADGQRVEVGVEEAAAGHALGGAEDLVVDAFAAAHPEPLVDHLLRQGQRLLHPERVVRRVGRRRTARPPWRGTSSPRRRRSPAGAVDLAAGAVRAHAGHPAVAVAEQARRRWSR